MSRHNQIRVIKHAQRERLEGTGAGVGAELSAQEKDRGLAATVKEWVSEFQQTRLARYQEITEQLDWRRGGDDSPNQQALISPNKGVP